MKKTVYATGVVLQTVSVIIALAFLVVGFASSLLHADVPSLPLSAYQGWTGRVLGLVDLLRTLYVPLLLGPWLLSYDDGRVYVYLFVTLIVAALVLRRWMTWRRLGLGAVPQGYSHSEAVVLAICVISVVLYMAWELFAPILPSMGGLLAYPIVWSEYVMEFLFALFWLFIELKSIRYEGWWPKPARREPSTQ